MKDNKVILVCDDDPVFNLGIQYVISSKYECLTCLSTEEAAEIIQNANVDLLLLDVKFRNLNDGLRFIPVSKELDPDLGIVVISGNTEFEAVRQAMRLGAWDYVSKNFDENELMHTIEQALEKRALLQTAVQHRLESDAFQSQYKLAGKSQYVQNLDQTIERAKESRSSVLITGETGTGKEIVARLLRRRFDDGCFEPFVTVDSAWLGAPDSERVLFGQARDVSQGIHQSKPGIFEIAKGGVLFFDEVANLPIHVQSMLLQTLKDQEFRRVGSPKPIKVDFRVVGSTSQNLEECIKAGTFSQELYQRLNSIPIQLSPLRDRIEDLPSLVAHFTERLPLAFHRLRFTEEALQLMAVYFWPGNVRELKNLIEYLTTMNNVSEPIDVADLPQKIRHLERIVFSTPLPPSQSKLGFYEQVSQFEKNLLTEELAKVQGNISRMAINIGIDRSYLNKKLKELKIQLRD